MRWIVLTAIVLAAGCASAPKEPPVEREVPLDSSNIVEAQRAGYKVMNKDGHTLYCKTQSKTGTHARKETSCLTEQEWQDVSESSRRGVEAMRRSTPPKQGK